ncbi:MAG: hypothetical protein LBH59_07400 [Planctomycetaceae bacterium]|nr:hypothetical protein [Planctomycetaceae bacterium]
MLWDNTALSYALNNNNYISLNQFLQLNNDNWTDINNVIINNRTLVVAGLDVAMDSFDDMKKLKDYLSETIYSAILSYQNTVADGGREAGLIFYFVNNNRFHRVSLATNLHNWEVSVPLQSVKIEICKLLFNGAYDDVKLLYETNQPENILGLHHPRIS